MFICMYIMQKLYNSWYAKRKTLGKYFCLPELKIIAKIMSMPKHLISNWIQITKMIMISLLKPKVLNDCEFKNLVYENKIFLWLYIGNSKHDRKGKYLKKNFEFGS